MLAYIILQALLQKIPEGTDKLENLFNQHETLLTGCDRNIIMSVRVELDTSRERISNLEAGLKTWREFLIKIDNNYVVYTKLAGKMQNYLDEASALINNASCVRDGKKSRNYLNNKLQTLIVSII